jgi:hypothetical protein
VEAVYIQEGWVTQHSFTGFLGELASHLAHQKRLEKVLFVFDNAGAHKTDFVKEAQLN